MNEERRRLGLTPRETHIVEGSRVDGESRGDWQGIYQE